MSVKQQLLAIGLPLDRTVVVGSGTLHALGLRETTDIDLVVPPEEYERLKKLPGWEEKWHDEKTSVLLNDPFDVGLGWDNPDDLPNLGSLLEDSIEIDGVRYVNLPRLRGWKERKGRPKDLRDIELIDAYLARV